MAWKLDSYNVEVTFSRAIPVEVVDRLVKFHGKNAKISCIRALRSWWYERYCESEHFSHLSVRDAKEIIEDAINRLYPYRG